MQLNKDMVVGAVLGALSSGYGLASFGIDQAGVSQVGPAFLPRVIAALMLLLRVLLLVQGWRRARHAPAPQADTAQGEGGEVAERPNYLPVLLTLLLLGTYIGLLEPLGFVPATAGYLLLQFNISAPRGQRHLRAQAFYLVLAVVLAWAVNYAFVEGFDVMLPQGILE